MSLTSVLNIAGSGMTAQSVRLNTTASNIANADSASSSVDETYRAQSWFSVLESEVNSKSRDVNGFMDTDAAMGAGVNRHRRKRFTAAGTFPARSSNGERRRLRVLPEREHR